MSMGPQSEMQSSRKEEVDFYASRATTGVFLETSLEQEKRVRENSPF